MRRCPHCNGRSRVLTTIDRERHTSRRRECLVCLRRFTTSERIVGVSEFSVSIGVIAEANNFSISKLQTPGNIPTGTQNGVPQHDQAS